MEAAGAAFLNNRLFVGNLALNTTEEAIEDMFSAAGDVQEVHIATDRGSRRPQGFGFVTMGSPKEAEIAIATLNGAMLDGRALKVNDAQEKIRRQS